MATYKGYPLLVKKPNWATLPKVTHLFSYETFGEIGSTDWNFTQVEPKLGYEFSLQCTTKAEIWEIWEFFDNAMGRLHGFWMPSWHREVTVVSPFIASDSVIEIEDIEWEEYWRPCKITGRYLYMEWPDGTYVIRGITGAADDTHLSLDGVIGKGSGSNPERDVFVCFLLFVRADIDHVKATYFIEDAAEFLVPVITVGAEEPITVTSTSTTSSTASSTSTSSTTHTARTTWSSTSTSTTDTSSTTKTTASTSSESTTSTASTNSTTTTS